MKIELEYMAGDMLELISGRQIHAARHRVARTGKRARMSVTFFVNPNDYTLIDGTYTAGSLLSKRLQEMKY
jgi:isopenicillin N synthase-like dioxygenase